MTDKDIDSAGRERPTTERDEMLREHGGGGGGEGGGGR